MAVSLAMNGRPGISAETAKKIQDYAAEVGYQPSVAARTMALRSHARLRSGTAGVVIVENDYDMRAILAISVIQAAGLLPFVIVTNPKTSVANICEKHRPELLVNLTEEDLPEGTWVLWRAPRGRFCSKLAEVLASLPGALEQVA
jgi:DNA-binding LacI/PurR family transcriptional regulator